MMKLKHDQKKLSTTEMDNLVKNLDFLPFLAMALPYTMWSTKDDNGTELWTIESREYVPVRYSFIEGFPGKEFPDRPFVINDFGPEVQAKVAIEIREEADGKRIWLHNGWPGNEISISDFAEYLKRLDVLKTKIRNTYRQVESVE